MNNFQELDVYKRASSMFPQVYTLVRSWNIADQRELGSQIIRAANSIHANIAEGYSKTPKEFRRYIGTAIGSCDELVSHLKDACNVRLITQEQHDKLVESYNIVGKQLTRLKQNWK